MIDCLGQIAFTILHTQILIRKMKRRLRCGIMIVDNSLVR